MRLPVLAVFVLCHTALITATIPNNEPQCDPSDDSCVSPNLMKLRNGVLMPRVGQGLAAMKGDETKQSMRIHVEHGFRHFDGAQSKEWYDDVAAGQALHEIITESNGKLNRDDFFIVSKVHPLFLSRTEEAVKEMFQSWKLQWDKDHMDLVLLHYAECGDWVPDCKKARPADREGDWRKAWRDLESLYTAGKIRAIGVSNFNLEQLEALWAFAQVPPHVVQMWLDPYHQARDEETFAKSHGAFVVSYSSLGPQWEFGEVQRNLVLESRVLSDIASKHDTSVPLVVLSWMLRHNLGIIPRSTNPQHIEENAQLLDVDWAVGILDEEDDERIDALDGVFDTWVREDCDYHRDEGECEENDDVAANCQATCRDMDY